MTVNPPSLATERIADDDAAPRRPTLEEMFLALTGQPVAAMDTDPEPADDTRSPSVARTHSGESGARH